MSFPEAFTGNFKALDELPQAMVSARQVQQGRLKELSVPNRKTEDWRYSSKRIKMLDEVAQPCPDTKVDVYETLGDFDGYRAVIINGILDEKQSQLPDNSECLVQSFTRLGEAEVEQVLAGIAQTQTNLPFALANTANHSDGLFIKIKANCKLDKPLLIHCHNEGLGSTFPRMFVHVEAGAEAQIIEEHTGKTDSELLSASLMEVNLEANAKLSLIRLDMADESMSHIGTTLVNAKRDSRLETHCFGFGGKLRRHDLKVRLNEPGAECLLNGICVALGDQHYDNHTELEHVAAHCNSEENYRCIAADSAHIVFNGRIHIHRDAQKTSGAMNNKNLLLSSKAEIDTKPELEIYADDVKCAHGATVGQLDAEEVYYLQTRGINKQLAETMLTLGFVLELVQQVPNEACQNLLTQRLENFIASAVRGM